MFNSRKTKAFTLIELLVVIAIIAILTAIVTANFGVSKSKARDAKRILDITNLSVALGFFFDKCNEYPQISSNMPNLADSCRISSVDIPLSNFISVIPTAPSPGTYEYGVNNTSNPTDYVLKTVLENNNSVLTDAPKSNFSSITDPDIDCSVPLAYCIQPR